MHWDVLTKHAGHSFFMTRLPNDDIVCYCQTCKCSSLVISKPRRGRAHKEA